MEPNDENVSRETAETYKPVKHNNYNECVADKLCKVLVTGSAVALGLLLESVNASL